MDTLEGTLQSQAEALKVAQETAQGEIQSAKDELQVQADLLTETRAALAKAQSDAAAAATLAARDAQIERQTMQMTIERLTEQLSESKALHIARAMQPAAPVPSVQPEAPTKEKK